MAKPNFEEWKKQTLGHQIDLDNQSFDCVDVSKSWAQFVYGGQSWQKVFCWGNAKDLWYNAPSQYWDRVQDPQVGDIVCMGAGIGGGYGHTGVVVAVNGGNITIYQQNTFTQQPVYTGLFSAHASYIQGYLRPKTPFDLNGAPALLGFQRVASYAAKYRSAPNSGAELLQTFVGGDTYDFKGFVHGEVVDGNDVWFVGKYTGGYVWSGAFTDISTHDLPDLTPAKAIQPFQRQIGTDAMNYRKTPQVAPDNVIQLFDAGEILDFKGYVEGQNIDGNNVWFVGKYSGGYVWSGGFTDSGTHDLPNLTSTPSTPTTPTVPTPPQYPDLSAKVIDISSHNEVVDFALAKSSVRGVVAKAGHTGKSYGGIQPQNEDPTFKKYKQEFGDKLVGAYWYGYPSLDPVTEANAFLTAVGEVPATFTYWLDIETPDGVNDQAKVNEWCNTFLLTVEKAIKRKCGVYCNRNWYDKILTDVTKAERPIWLAHYGISEFQNAVKNQVGHQYSDTGKVPGFALNDDVDLNAVTEGFFIKLAPPTDPVEPTNPDDPVIVQPTPDPAEPDVVTRIKTVAVNATVTFVQAFLATWAATGFQLDKVVLAGAVGGALSLVWNTILKPFAISQGWLKA